MPLPKIDHPTFSINIPSTKKKVKFRPFLVKEEKILLMAKESEDPVDILTAIKQVISNCSIDPIEVDELAQFDIEYCFLKLRANSVNNTVKVSYIDNEDGKTYDFEIDLLKLEVQFPENMSNDIKIGKKTGIIMKYPNGELYDDRDTMTGTQDADFLFTIKCMDKVYDGEQVYDLSTFKRDEIVEFVDNLDTKTMEKINAFMGNLPKLYHKIEYKNSKNTDRKIELTTLTDFFTLR